MTSIKTDAVKSWFKGKGLEKVVAALELLLQSEAQGYWVKGASRSVRAALSQKSRRAQIVAKTLNYDYTKLSDNALNTAYYALAYGSITNYVRLSLQEATVGLPDGALEHYIDFRPVADLIARLDAAKPQPTITKIGASPLVTTTLNQLGASAVDACPIKWERIEVDELDKKTLKPTGRKVTQCVGTLLWPAGTKHGTSIHSTGSHCEACGHRIYNPFNWCPLVLTTAEGPKSLWVGRDCALTLFGVKLDGDLELASGQPASPITGR